LHRQFEVRLAPALGKKPTKDDGEKDEKEEKPADPFAPPYIPDLFVAENTVKEDEDDAGEGFVVLVRRLPLSTVLRFR
jgi:ATP adenylyltransferase